MQRALRVSTALLGLTLMMPTWSAAAQDESATFHALSVGKTNWYTLGGTTASGAKQFADHMRAGGYESALFTNGRNVGDLFGEAMPVEVLFIHGHGHPGNITPNENGGQVEYFEATIPADSSWDIFPPPYIREWDDYLPTQIDDTLLAILSGCETSRTHATWGSLPEVLKQKGVDSAVTMSGKPLIPAAESATPNSLGNYFWGRVGYYLRGKQTLSNALSKAKYDLLAKEGSASGWNTYVISGAAAVPGSTTVVPPKAGSLLPISAGVQPGHVGSLRVTSQRSQTLPNGQRVVDYETDEGPLLRRAASDGQLLMLAGEPRATGPVRMTADQAKALAVEFATAESRYTPEDLGAPIVGSHSPVRAGVVTTVEYRFTGRDDRPAVITVDVDRRSGEVTYYSMAQGRATGDGISWMSAVRAESLAKSLVGGGTVVASERHVWDDAGWLVTVDEGRDHSGFARLHRIRIHATTGDVLEHAVSA